MKKTTLVAASLLSLFASLNVYAQDKPVVIPQVTNEWHGSISPYLWGVNVTGSLHYDQSKLGTTTMGTGQLLQNLNIGGMLFAELHKGNFGVMADLFYAKMTLNKSSVVGQVDLGSKTTAETGVYTFAGTYTLHNTNTSYVDALAGVRVLSLKATTNISIADTPYSAVAKMSSTIVDPIVGVKGRFRIADTDYFVPFYVDVGGGSSSTQVTSQQILGVGKAYEWGEATLAFKNLYYKQKIQSSATADLNLYGVIVGATFRF
jgi:hypothetical protein